MLYLLWVFLTGLFLYAFAPIAAVFVAFTAGVVVACVVFLVAVAFAWYSLATAFFAAHREWQKRGERAP